MNGFVARQDSRGWYLVLAFLVVVAALVVMPAAPASAHHAALSGSAKCVDGGWEVTWTVADPTGGSGHWSYSKTMGIENVSVNIGGELWDYVEDNEGERKLVDGRGIDFTTDPTGSADTSTTFVQFISFNDASPGDEVIVTVRAEWYGSSWGNQDTNTNKGADGGGAVYLNGDCPTSLTLKKVVEGGDADAGSWTLIAKSSSQIVFSGKGKASSSVEPGTYLLSEEGSVEYYVNGTSWKCDTEDFTPPNQVTVNYGDEVECTITNSFDPPPASLTLVKNVKGDADAGSWTLIAVDAQSGTVIEGTSPASNTELAPGTYALSETGSVEWYDNGTAWECTGASGFEAPNLVTLEYGDDAECSITNVFNPRLASLTLVKRIVNPSQGPTGATPQDWLLSASGSTSFDGYGEASSSGLQPGDYTLGESGSMPGFENGTQWVCEGGQYGDGQKLEGDVVTLGYGDNVECVISNTYTPPRLTLVKVVESNTGDGLTSNDWCVYGMGLLEDQPYERSDDVKSVLYLPCLFLGEVGLNDLAFATDIEEFASFGLGGVGSATSLVYAGTYSLGEEFLGEEGGDDGYTASWICTNEAGGVEYVDFGDGSAEVFVDHGDDITCTVTNENIIPPPTTTVPPPTTTVPVSEPTLDLAVDKTGVVVESIQEEDGVATVLWTITVFHGATSETDAVGATLSDTAPEDMTFVSVESADLTCSIIANTLSCDPFDLALGDSVSVVITATTTEAGDYENVAVVEVDGDTVESNNEDPAEVEIIEVLGVEILPETGADSDTLVYFAGVLVLLGSVLVLGSRRREGRSFVS